MLTNDEAGSGGNGYDPSFHVLEIAGNAIVGGMEKYVYNLVQHLPNQGFKVTCVTPFHSAFTSSLRQLGSEVYITIMDNDPYWRSIQFVTQLVRYQHIDLIHAHMPRAHVLAGIVGSLTGVPVVATVHGMEITNQELAICRTTGSHLTVVCQEAYSQGLALGLPPDRMTLIPNGVDLKVYNTNRTGASFRKALHISPDVTLVGFVGRLAWEKGPDTFVQMAEMVHKQLPDVHFAIVGEGPEEDEVKKQILAAGMENYIHMAGLWTNTWEVYPAFDVVAQTSRVEGMPFALLEAMACGKPVAAFGVGGVGEIIEVGSTGLLAAGTDVHGLASGLVNLLECPERMRQYGQAGRKRIEEYFDLQHSTKTMGNLFHRILGKASKEMQPKWTYANSETRDKTEHQSVELDPNLFQKRK